MKKRELNTTRKKSVEELDTLVKELEGKLGKAYVDISIGKEKNLASARLIKREIAQVKTLIAEKQKKTIIAEKQRKEDPAKN